MAIKLPRAAAHRNAKKVRRVSFSGLDMRPGAVEGSLKKSANMSLSDYPVLASRKKFSVVKNFFGRAFYGFGFSEKLYYCAEGEDGKAYFYYDDEPYLSVAATDKTFVKVNGLICVFPDKMYFSETSREAKNILAPYNSLEELHEATADETSVKSGDIYIAGNGVYSYNSEGVWKGNLTHSGDENPTPYSHQAQTQWIYISDVYGALETDEVFGKREDGVLIMTEETEGEGTNTVTDWNNGEKLRAVKIDDAVTLTIRFRTTTSPYKSVYKKYETSLKAVKTGNRCYRYSFSGIDVPESVDGDGNKSLTGEYKRYSARIEKTVPDFKVMFCHDNRLWGACDSKIYASALGDPTVFGGYSLSASSAWALAVLSDGDFTGGCSFSGYPTFFKENMIIRISGDYPSEYRTFETRNVPGVKKGGAASLCALGGNLYYASEGGICAYSGAFPRVISDALGDEKIADVFSGADAERAYFSFGGALYAYEVKRGMWICAADEAFTFFASEGGSLLAYSEDGNRILAFFDKEGAQKEQGEVYSEAVFNRVYLGTLDKKETGRIAVGIEAEKGAELDLYISCDGGEFFKVKSLEGSGIYHIPLKLRRCGFYSVKLKGRGMWRISALENVYFEGTRI